MYGLGFTLASEAPSIVRTAGQTYEEQINASGDYVGPVGTPGSQTLTQWLNANQTAVMMGGLGFLALVLVMKAGR